MPANAQAANYQAVIGDNSLSIDMNGSGLTGTIPANATVAFPIGAVLIWTNLNASALTVTIGGSDTLTLSPGTSTGARSVAQNGVLTARKIGATSWLCWGAGVS